MNVLVAASKGMWGGAIKLKEGRPACKSEWWGAGIVICLEGGANLHMAQLMPLSLTVFCFSIIQIVFTFLVPAFRQSSSTCHTAFLAQHFRPSGVLTCWPNGLELTPRFYLGSNEQYRLF